MHELETNNQLYPISVYKEVHQQDNNETTINKTHCWWKYGTILMH